MKRFKHLVIAIIAALIVPAFPANAADLPIGMAQAKNLVQRTVTIDDQTYKVTSRTEIFDLAGRPMGLENVETAGEADDIVELDRVTYEYDAAGDVLVLLRAVPVPR